MAALIAKAAVVLSWAGVKSGLISWKLSAGRGQIKSNVEEDLCYLVQHRESNLKTMYTASISGNCLVKGFAQKMDFPLPANKC